MKRLAIQICSVVVFFVLWKGYVTGFDVSPLVLPPPEDVLHALVRLMGRADTYYHIYTTLAECLGGFVIAVALGTVIGQVLGRVPLLDTIFKPFVVALQLTPKVALIPLFILWFGFGIESKIVISALMAFFPVFANSYLGAKSVDTGLVEVFQVGNASGGKRFRLLVIPASLPYILTGMEMAIVLSIIGAWCRSSSPVRAGWATWPRSSCRTWRWIRCSPSCCCWRPSASYSISRSVRCARC